MRVLACGSRKWTDETILAAVLDGMLDRSADLMAEFVLIEGGQKTKDSETGAEYGADFLAACWAENAGVTHLQFPADWDRYGKAAGPIRNQQMLDEGKPDVVIAFKDGFQADRWRPLPANAEGSTSFLDKAKGGTEDLVRRAKAMGIPNYVISHG